MKILIISLARIGDIYQSWPALRAFARLHPAAEIHFLTRKKFQGAFAGLGFPVTIHPLPTESCVEEFIVTKNFQPVLKTLKSFLSDLQGQNFDQLINLTFSPLSASIAGYLRVAQCRGLSRHPDLSLQFNDDWSAYFYAQMGIHKWNRIHMIEFYANFLQVELTPSDFYYQRLAPSPYQFQAYFALHIGASQSQKNLSAKEWGSFVEKLLDQVPQQLVVLGTEREVIKSLPQHPRLNSRLRVLVGETNLDDVFQIIDGADLFIGPDSSLLQVANLLQKKSFNLSFSSVRFWESGPKAPGSIVYRAQGAVDLEEVVSEIKKCALNLVPGIKCYSIDPETNAYHGLTSSEEDEAWSLICSLYFQLPHVVPLSPTALEGIEKLQMVNDMVLEFLAQIKNQTDLDNHKHLLDAADAAFGKISQIVPSLSPITDWLMTERSRIAPTDFDQLLKLLAETFKRHQQLQNYLTKYHWSETAETPGVLDESNILSGRTQE